MRTIYCLFLVLWVSYCPAAPTRGRDAAAGDVPTSSSAHVLCHATTTDQRIKARMNHLLNTYGAPSESSQHVQQAMIDLENWVVYDAAVFLAEIESQSGLQRHMSTLTDMRNFISYFCGHIGIGPAPHLANLLSKTNTHIGQVIDKAIHQQYTEHLREAAARPKFIDFLGVGAEPEYPQSGPISSPTFHDFFSTESEHQRLPDADEAPTRSATALRDVHSRQSNPHGYSRHDSTHTGSGSTSGRPRYSDRSSHGAGPSRRDSRRDSSRGKELE
ncbi:hypothetical protein SeLEV6574_g06479 [Synchytrium endobioticum]|uniref:Secreted protein n=1 Tax=Synchytrium endobioticum TaxID=286115 RepID=A0A507CNH4_9FUNG|nr:hypothetical protein SeLEV6574_g06479 [Synchytrium endobioticum]